MMAKRNEEKAPQAVAENQADEIRTAEQEMDADQLPAIPEDEKDNSGTAASQEDQKKPESSEEKSETAESVSKLESLSVLADRHRIPSWHQAALLRYMGWQDDKMVTDADYRKALDELKHRRIGGGRK